MKRRTLEQAIRQICFADHKMAFVSGPRQCGKTTLAKLLLAERSGAYWNWDDVEFRRRWTRSPRSILPDLGETVPLVLLDKIHKAKFWKRSLKGVFDTLETPADILVTGSARLDVDREGGDSLLGRYYHFRMHPFSLREMESTNPPTPEGFLDRLFSSPTSTPGGAQERLEALMVFGGFPEPLFAQNTRKARLWRQNRVECVIREDLRDLTRIPELSRVEMLAALLPDQVGSLLSVNSLREDLEISFDTARRWLTSLNELYYIFELRPFHQRIRRSLRKVRKLYLADYSEVPDQASRFENLVAAHLLKTCHFWTDTGEGHFELRYLRNKEGEEIDFLITRDAQPWLPVEVKLSHRRPTEGWRRFMPQLGIARGLQILLESGHRRIFREDGYEVLVVSADESLSHFA